MMEDDEGCNKKMEVKLLVFFKGQLGIIQRIVWF